MNEKPGFWKKFGKAMDGKGFYMVLVLCLVVLGASGYYLYRTMSAVNIPADTQVNSHDIPTAEISTQPDVEVDAAAENAAEVSGPAEVEVPAAVTEAAEQPVMEPVEQDQEALSTDEVETAAPVEEEAVLPVTPEETAVEEPALTLSWPADGEVIGAFSDTELVYHEAMGDWRTHTGIDISAGLGTQVFAAGDGTVTAIEDNPVTGTTITLSHANGLESVYGNLDPDTLNVAVGDVVSTHDTLAYVGTSAAGEDIQTGHVHFAVNQDGVSVDPMEFLN